MNNLLNQLLIFEQTKGDYTEEETSIIYETLQDQFKTKIVHHTLRLTLA